MTIRNVFEAGLADYLIRMGIKNVAGSTPSERRPSSPECGRHVLDISHYESLPWSFGMFWVRVYCDTNAPSAAQVIPARSYKNKDELLHALDTVYAPWAGFMKFRIESPPQSALGTYDHYEFDTDRNGRVARVSAIILSPSRQLK